MHRPQQAGLPDGGHHVGRHDDIALDRDLDVGVPASHPIEPTLPTTTSSTITGEFDSIVPTFGSSTW